MSTLSSNNNDNNNNDSDLQPNIVVGNNNNNDTIHDLVGQSASSNVTNNDDDDQFMQTKDNHTVSDVTQTQPKYLRIHRLLCSDASFSNLEIGSWIVLRMPRF